MATVSLQLPILTPAQAQIEREACRYNVVDAGRRFGKSLFGVSLMADPVLQGYPVGWFAPTYKYLADVWREAKRILLPITTAKNEQDRRIETLTGGAVEMWTLDNKDAGRGRKYKRVIIDEAAMVPALLDIWNAAISPTLMDLRGDTFVFSTPKGHNGFWQMWQWGQGGARPAWMSWHFPTSANPHINPAEIEEMRRTRPERIFRQEIMAEFLEDAGGVFRRVMDAATAMEQQGAIEGHEYVIGVDWAKMSDFTVFAVGDLFTRQIVYLDRFNQIDYRIQRQRLAALSQRFRPSVILAERNSIGEPNLEDLQAAGLPVRGFTTTNESKAQIVEDLALAFETGAIGIIADPVLFGELPAYEMDRLPSGKMRYNAPEGVHDDTVIATALAWHAMAVSEPASVQAGTLEIW
jgi:hypothetical protein